MMSKKEIEMDSLTGKNTIHLNAETLRRAIEYWLNNVQFKSPVKVVSVKVEERGTYDHVTSIVEFDVANTGTDHEPEQS